MPATVALSGIVHPGSKLGIVKSAASTRKGQRELIGCEWRQMARTGRDAACWLAPVGLAVARV
jgi:hypothetical protein